MSLQSILSLVFSRFAYFSKEKLLLILKDLILNYKILDKKYEAQKLKNKILEEKILEFESKETKEKIKDVNKSYSKPTSKQPEWEDKGVGNDGKGKKKRRGKKGRKGSGNKPKSRNVTDKKTATVENCAFCGKDIAGCF